MTRSVVTDPTTALDHAGRDLEHRDSLPLRLAVAIGPILVLLAALFFVEVLVVKAWLGGGTS